MKRDIQMLYKSIFFIGMLALVIFLQFRVQLMNGFTVLYGDQYDALIVVTILEHWWNVFQGLSSWTEVGYFHPYTNSIAQTDAYFMIGIIYAPFRYIGLDPFISTELSNITIRIIGFISFFYLARKFFSISFFWALVAAGLFVLSSGLTAHGQRIQFSSISFAPVLIILIWSFVNSIYKQEPKQLMFFGALSGMFVGAWSLTCFYMTWFFIYFFVFFCISLFFYLGKSNLLDLTNRIIQYKYQLLFVLFITLISFYPLLSVYLPKSNETGMRTYASVHLHTVPIEGIIQTGKDNFLFGRIYNNLLNFLFPNYKVSGEYYNTGISPILFFIFIGGLYVIFKNTQKNILLRSLALSTLITWFCTLNLFGYSLWYVIYSIFPGAKALNVVSAYQIFLSIPVILIAIKYLSSIDLPKVIVSLLVILLFVEELNSGYITLKRNDEISRFANFTPPPKECESFYVSGWQNQATYTPMTAWINQYYAHNVTAMIISVKHNIPTINGIASFNPPDWNFGDPNNADYRARVKVYIKKHQLNNVCRLNLNAHEWVTNEII
ncbi:MAG: hypothetical protein GQ583_09105 [Methyloprofundus sp.]|nr:hypothetical protein [Methyloprofundus sp.]